jgi:hypothetical protein
MAQARSKQSDDLVRATADQHLAYEIEMLCRTLADLNRLGRAKIDDAEWSQITTTALLESWAIHSRVLRAFLFSESSEARTDDVLAQDFFNDDDWEKIRPTPGAALKEVSPRVGKEIAHLTYTRNSVKPEDRGWEVAAITGELTDGLELFLERVPSKRVPSDLRERCQAWIDLVIPR